MLQLEVSNLSKRYDDRWALREVSFSSGPGMLGLVGPNGAGKTTLMRIIATLLDQTDGKVTWNGLDTSTDGDKVRQVLGYLPQEFGLYPELSARQFLRYIAAIKGIPATLARRRVDELIEVVNLERDADRKLGGYSGGMKQRVGIAQALLNDPELLIVDEPTAGLDPEERVRFRNLLGSLTGQRLVILSSHIIADVEVAASRLILLKEGEIVADATPSELLASAKGHVWSVTCSPEEAILLQNSHKVSGLVHTADGVTLRILGPQRPHAQAQQVEPSLEDVYLLEMSEHSMAADQAQTRV